MRNGLPTLIAIALINANVIKAQVAPPVTSRFDVAAIKRNTSGDQFQGIAVPGGGRFTATNAPLRGIITAAYRLQENQLVELPSWADSERYDITARAEQNIDGEAIWPLVRALLEDRFRLRFHRETRQLPVYALVVSKPGKLVESERVCESTPPRTPAPPEPGKLGCGGLFTFPAGDNGIRINASKSTIEPFSTLLSRLTGKPVINRTGLTGKYDIDIVFAGDPNRPTAAEDAPPDNSTLPSLFTVIQDQLGLKLDSQKGPVEVLVVDHIERPSEN